MTSVAQSPTGAPEREHRIPVGDTSWPRPIGMDVSARGSSGAAGLLLGHVPFGAAGSVAREGCGSRLDAI